MKKFLRLLVLLATIWVPWTMQAQFNYTCGFETDADAAGWTLINGSQSNKWHIGSAASNGGTQGLYISNDNGTTNNYTISSTSFVYACHEMVLAPGLYTFACDWACQGESNYDAIRIYLAPVSATLTAGQDPNGGTSANAFVTSTTPPAGWINLDGGKLNLHPTWTNLTTDFVVSSNATYKLVIAWVNDASSGAAPCAIDNVVVTQPTCPRPVNLAATNVTPTTADLVWTETGSTTSWRVVYSAEGTTTEYEETATDTLHTLQNLTANTVYNVAVYALCDGADTSLATVGTFRTDCDEVGTLPFIQNFEGEATTTSSTTSAYIPCWVRLNNGTSYGGYPYLSATASYNHTMGGTMGLYWYNSTTQGTYGDYQCVVLPSIDTTVFAINQLQLTFWAKVTSTSYNATFLVGVMGDPNQISTFQPVDTIHINGVTAWNEFITSFADFTGYGKNLAVMAPRGTATWYAATDDFAIELIPDCPRVENIVVRNTGNHDATISWSEMGTASGWHVQYYPQGANASSALTEYATDTIITLTGLDDNTTYNVIITVDCGQGFGGSNTSVFTTTCDYLDSLPYVQNFDNAATGASNSMAFVDCWHRLNNGTTSFGYPYVSSSSTYNHTPGGAKGLYWYNTTTQTTYGDYQCVVLPAIDTTLYPINTLQLSFWAKPSSTSYYPVFQVGVMGNHTDINSFQPVATINVGNNTTWTEFITSFANFAGHGQCIAVKATRPTSSWYAYVDDFKLEVLPACPAITAVEVATTASAATLSWDYQTALGITPDGYTLTYGYAGDNPANATSVTVTDNHYVLTGLDADTTYVVTITTNCTDGDGEVFTTTFNTQALPCLSYDLTQTRYDTITGIVSSNYEIPVNNFYANTFSEQLFLASELGGAGTLTTISFEYNYTLATTYKTNCKIYLGETSMSSLSLTSFVAPENMTLVYTGPLNCSSGWNTFVLNQPYAYNGGNLVVAVVDNSGDYDGSEYTFATHAASGKAISWYSDDDQYPTTSMSQVVHNFRNNIIFKFAACTQSASCSAPMAFVDSVSAHDIYLSWLPGYQETAWDIEYRAAGTTAWTVDATGITSTSYTLSGLTANTDYTVRVVVPCSDTTLYSVVTAHTPCTAIALPYTQTFENEATGASTSGSAFVDCWVRLNNGSSYGGYPYVSTTAGYNHTVGGTKGLYWYNSTSSGSYGDYQCIVLPPVASSYDVSTLQLTFWSRATSTSYRPIFQVGVMTDANDITTFVPVDTVEVTAATAWTEFEVPLSGYTGNGKFVAIMAERSTAAWYANVDDVMLDLIPDCPHVRDVVARNVTGSTATVAWQEIGSATSWDIEYGPHGFTLGEGTTALASVDSIDFSGLTPVTAYDVYITPICSEGISQTTMFTFYTACEPLTSMPIIEDFDGIAGSTSTSVTAGNAVLPRCWSGYTDGTATNYTGYPIVHNSSSYANSGTQAARFYCYGATYGNQVLILPPIDPTAIQLSDLMLTLSARTSSSTYGGWAEIGVMSDPADLTTFVAVDTLNCNGSTTYQEFNFTFDSYTGNGTYVAINAHQVGSSYSYNTLYVDDVTLDYIPACLRVEDLTASGATTTSVNLSWSEVGTATAWNVEYGAAGFMPGTGTIVVANTDNFVLTGLTHSTSYDAYVSPVCPSGNAQRALVSFQTACAGLTTLPLVENFDGIVGSTSTSMSAGAAVLPNCWRGYSNSTSTSYAGYPIIYNNSTYANSGLQAARFYCYNATYGNQVLILPPVDASVYAVSDLMLSLSARAATSSQGGWAEIGVMTDPTDLTTFVPVDTLDCYSATAYQEFEFYFDNYTGNGTYVAINAHLAGSGYTYNVLYVDDVTLDVQPSCPRVSDIVLNGLDSNMLAISWTERGSATSWTVEYGVHGFTAGSGTSAVVTSLPFVVNGLATHTQYDFYVTPICATGDSSATSRMATFSTAGSYQSLPFSCDFETASQNAVWSLVNGSNANKWYISNAVNNGGSNGLYISSDNGASNTYTSSISTSFAYVDVMLPAAGDYAFSYDWQCQGESSLDYLRVALVPFSETFAAGSTVPTNFSSTTLPAGWISLDGNNKLNLQSTWQNMSSDVTVATPGVYHLTFAWRNDGSIQNMPPAAVDNVQIAQLSCPKPQHIVASNITQSSADIAWTEVGSASAWQYRVNDGAPTTVTTTNCSLTGLTPSSAYTFSVRAICGAGDTSLWANYQFRTLCGAISVPYAQDFEIEPTGSSSTGSAFVNCWTRLNNGTSSGGYPYVGAATTYNHTAGGNQGLYWYNTTTTGSYGDYVGMVLPVIDSTVSVNTLQLSFWTKASADSYVPTFQIGVMTDPSDITSFVGIDTVNITTGTEWVEVEVPFNTYMGAGRYVAVKTDRATSSWYAYIDDVLLDYQPTCLKPTDFERVASSSTSLTISWTSAAPSHEVEYGVSGFTQGNGTTVTVQGNSVSLTGLDTATAYDIYVRGICSATDMSRWSNVATFVTDICDGQSGTVISGTGTSYNVPVNNYYRYTYSQELILASEMSGGAAIFAGIGYEYGYNTPSTSKTNVKIYIGHTTQSTLTTTTLVPVDSMQLVYSGNLNCTMGWNYFTFDNDFTWDGVRNVVVAVLDSSNAYDGISYVFKTAPANGLCVSYYSDSYPININNPSSFTGTKVTHAFRPNTQLISCGNSSCPTPTITSVSNDYGNITLSWAGAGTDYEVAVKTSTSGAWPAEIAVTGHSYTFSGLNAATSYDVRVRQVCADDEASAWAQRTVVTDSLPCFAPEGLSVSGMGYDNVRLTWTPGSNEPQWVLHVWRSDMNIYDTVSSYPTTISGLYSGMEYSAAVQAACGYGAEYSDWSDTITFTTEVCQPVSGVAVDAAHVTNSSAVVTWTAVGGTTAWQVNYGDMDFTQGQGTIVDATATSYTITGLETDSYYDVYVRTACTAELFSDWSTKVSFHTTVGIDSPEAQHISLFPNPTTGNVTVAWAENNGIWNLEVVDLQGRTVKSQTNIATASVQLTDLAAGTYFVRIYSDGVNAVKKLIVR